MVHHGNGKMTVSLNPPDLGQVEIHVTTRGKNVEISMKSEHDFAKSAIESSLGDLKASMEAQDLKQEMYIILTVLHHNQLLIFQVIYQQLILHQTITLHI